jgi:hypothetical protein
LQWSLAGHNFEISESKTETSHLFHQLWEPWLQNRTIWPCVLFPMYSLRSEI